MYLSTRTVPATVMYCVEAGMRAAVTCAGVEAATTTWAVTWGGEEDSPSDPEPELST